VSIELFRDPTAALRDPLEILTNVEYALDFRVVLRLAFGPIATISGHLSRWDSR